MSFATINPIAHLVPPVDNPQQPQPQPVADAANVLVQQFAQPESTQARTRAIWTMATMLTVAEFQDAMNKALDQAKANDKAAGFIPASDAKGRDKYGPMQSTLATVASQCRQVFGACKIDPESIVSATPDGAVVNPDLFPNWSKAYEKARAFLADKGIDWTGNTLSDKEQARKNKKASADDAEIEAAVKAKHPKAMGESLADYNTRIAPFMDEAEAEFMEKRIQTTAEKEFKKLCEKYPDTYSEILASMVELNNQKAEQEEAPM